MKKKGGITVKKAILAALMLCLLAGCGEVGGPGASRPTETETVSPAETSISTAEAFPPERSVEPDDPAGPETPELSPTPNRGDLTEEQVEQVNRAFMAHEEMGGVVVEREVNGFFTSYYADARELDFAEFLWYYPSDGDLGEEDLEEFAALAELPDFHWKKEYFAESGLTPSRLPVPTHRILRASVDETLRKYAGITTADLKHIEGTLYLKDYDAYYTFTSDFGPGSFTCEGGRVENDIAVLWSEKYGSGGYRDELTLEREGENWYIRSFLQVSQGEFAVD